MTITARPIVAIGNTYTAFQNKRTMVTFTDRKEATQAWLMLASMGVPAFLDAACDGWYPNRSTTAWMKPVAMDFSVIPDIKLEELPTAFSIYSKWMRCDYVVYKDRVYESIASIIREWRDIVESERDEVAA